VRAVLGTIDLDPASSDAAQEIVQAASYFTKQQDGLQQEWHGTVWLNPPYAQPLIAQFVSKLVSERRAGNVTAAIMLTHNYTSSAWFKEAFSVADALCFTDERVKFLTPEGDPAAPTQGQAFFYFGDNVVLFKREFSAIGFVVPCRWSGLDIPKYLRREAVP
jgi:ParB family transcriptional regulator, chromosome partitioning protein